MLALLIAVQFHLMKPCILIAKRCPQRKGLGKILVANAEETTLENGYKQIILHARITAQGFYEKLGYAPFGNIFTEVTIPHIAMQKSLQ